LNSALCCFLFTPTYHAPFLDRSALAYRAVQKSGAAARFNGGDVGPCLIGLMQWKRLSF
jgi:hypothetical protein